MSTKRDLGWWETAFVPTLCPQLRLDVMVSPNFFTRLELFAKSNEFSKLIPLGAQSIKKSNHLDNLCKIIAFAFRNYILGSDIEEFVTSSMVDIASNDVAGDDIFKTLQWGISILIESCGSNALRPYKKQQPSRETPCG